MTNAANGNNSQSTELTLYNVTLDIRQLYGMNQAAWQDGEQEFPEFGERFMVYSKNLEGVPFAFLSGTQEVHVPERKDAEGRKFAPQDGLRVYVSIFDTNTFGPAQLAQLTDQYLVNQLRGATADQLLNSGLWTIGRNSRHSTQGGIPPRMLKRYRHGVDKPVNPVKISPEPDSVPWGNGPATESDTFRSVREAQEKAAATIERVKAQTPVKRTPDKVTVGVLAQADAMRAAMNRQANTDEILPWEQIGKSGTSVRNNRDGTSDYLVPETPVKRGRGRPRKNPA